MAYDGSVKIGVGVDDKDAQKQLNQLRSRINTLEGKIAQGTAQKSGITRSLEEARAKAEETRQAIQELNAAYAANRAEREAKGSAITAQDTTDYERAQADIMRQLNEQTRILQAQDAQVEKLEGKEREITTQLQAQNAELERQQSEAGRLYQQVAAGVDQTKLKDGVNAISNGFDRGIKSMLKYGLGIRSLYVLFNRLRSYITDGIKQFAAYDSQTQASINGLKTALSGLRGSLATAFAPIFNAVAPALIYLIDLLSQAASAVAAFFAILGGKSTYKKAVAGISAVGGATSAAGGAAKEAKKYFSGLDELNIFESDSSSSGGGGGGGSGGGGGLEWVDEAIDTNSPVAQIAEFIRENLESAQLLVDEFGFVIGMVLAFSGHPLLGTAMMAYFGYKGITAAASNWGTISEQLRGQMGQIMLYVSDALLAIGAILAFSGVNIPLGIGLMAVAAAGFATTASANWGAIEELMRGPVGRVTAIVSGALIAIGAILAFSGVNIPLGLGMMLAGGIGLWASRESVDWEAIPIWIDTVLLKIKNKVTGWWQGAKAWIETAKNWVSDNIIDSSIFQGILDFFSNPIGTIDDWLSTAIVFPDDFWAQVEQWFVDGWEKFTSNPIVSAILDFFSNPLGTIDDLISTAITFDVTADVTDVKDSVPKKKRTLADFKAKIVSWIEALKNKFKDKVLDFQSQLTTWKDALKNKVLDFQTKLTTWKDSLKNKVVDFQSRLTTWNDALRDKVIDFTAKLTVWRDALKDKVIDFQSKITTWKDSIKDKTISSFSAILSGWSRASGWNAGGWNQLGLSGLLTGWQRASGWYSQGWDKLDLTARLTGVTMTSDVKAKLKAGYYAANGGVFANGRWSDIARYAAGGWPLGGQLFVAREAGPELVGTLKGHTAVMNNDQIVSSVAAGVASAIAGIEFHLDGMPTFPAVTPDMVPAVARGEVIPPQLLSVSEDLKDIKTALQRLIDGMPTGVGASGGTINVEAQVRERTLFDVVIDQGRLLQSQTGRNPFELA